MNKFRQRIKQYNTVSTGLAFPNMAQKLGIEIIPLGTAFEHKWIAEKWDKYEILKPFSKAVHYLGKPIFVDQDANLDQYNLL